jgi:hypothetical protein
MRILQSMDLGSRAWAVCLLIALLAVAVPVRLFAAPALPHQAAPGCHQSVPVAPTSVPPSYACCLAGHGFAIVQGALTAPPLLLRLSPALSMQVLVPEATARGFQIVPLLSGDPPGTGPLRL